jgi:hypothetical protein
LLFAKSGPSSAFGTFSPLAGRRKKGIPPRLRGEGKREFLPARGEKEKKEIGCTPLPACGERMPGGQVRGGERSELLLLFAKRAPIPPFPRTRGKGRITAGFDSSASPFHPAQSGIASAASRTSPTRRAT